MNATGAYYFYTLMDASKIDHKLIRFVPAVGDYSNSIGNCETHGPAWDVHFIPDILFWPPIAKRVCDRPCLTHGHRCRPSCCETRCINRYVWHCNLTSFNHYCLPQGLKEVCYEHQNACKCDCAYNHPYCYFWIARASSHIGLNTITQHI